MELKTLAAWKGDLESGALDPALQRLYGADSFGAPKLRQRFLEALEGFGRTFPERTLTGLFSAPAALRSAATTPIISRAGCWERR